MQLTSMSLENFRCFDKIDVTFDPQLTVFVGVNGAGKTAVLDAVAVLLKQMHLFVNNQYRNKINVYDVSVGATSTKLNYIVSSDNKNYTLRCNYKKNKTFAIDNDFFQNNRNFIDSIKYVRVPVVVYYSAKRVINEYHREIAANANPDDAYKNAFEPHIDFSSTLTWFIEKSSQEALEAVHSNNLEHRIPELNAVRQAVSRALGEYNEPYVGETPPQLFITRKESPNIPLNLQQLSDGYRTMLALVMDLARRMALANADRQWPEGENVLHSPGIVLIDEVELHLHPSWQQTVLPRLMEIFPNVQFIVTTHSPQVITSLEAKHIRILGDGGKVLSAPQGTLGAEASRILKQVFRVDNRPPSQARNDLEEYRSLVYGDKWDTPRALALRALLDKRYGGQEPELVELDMHIENRKWEMSEEGGDA